MNKAAWKSMLSLAFYLVLLIAMWAVLGHVIFPEKSVEDTLKSSVDKYDKLLVQLAENSADPEKWPGVAEAAEAREKLDEIGVEQIATEAGVTRFSLAAGDVADVSRALVYAPDGDYVFPFSVTDWISKDTEAENAWRWEGGSTGKGYVNVRRLNDHFFYEEICNPA